MQYLIRFLNVDAHWNFKSSLHSGQDENAVFFAWQEWFPPIPLSRRTASSHDVSALDALECCAYNQQPFSFYLELALQITRKHDYFPHRIRHGDLPSIMDSVRSKVLLMEGQIFGKKFIFIEPSYIDSFFPSIFWGYVQMTDCHTIFIQFYRVTLQMFADRWNDVVLCFMRKS